MLRSFVEWWATQMLDLVPERLTRFNANAIDALLIEPDGAPQEAPRAVTLAIRRRHQNKPLGRFAIDRAASETVRQAIDGAGRPAETWLCLPPGPLIEKQLTLPLAAERDLDRVVAYEMDRETPFSADEVWWQAEIVSRDRPRNRMLVRLSVVPRTTVAETLTGLAAIGLRPTALSAQLIGGGVRKIAFGQTQGRRRIFGVSPVRVTLAGCAAAAIALAVVPFVRQEIALGDVEDRIAALRPDADQADILRHRLDGGSGAQDILAAQRGQLGDALAILDRATLLLPDDTHLTDFSMHALQLTMSGQSGDAARLIGILAGDPAFKGPTFSAPVTRTEDHRRDRFSISAEARP